jgi:hypothetical protein
MDGIGTICHEFSHVLGLPDFYDTDYEGSGGTAPNPSEWSIMASGSYLNQSRTPPSYSAYERKMVGWITPQEIKANGNYTLQPLNTANECLFITAQSPNEYFYFENRQQTGWDAYLPGHGMLVYRIDLTNPLVWQMNTINNNPAHLYYEILCADNNPPAKGSNAFPGSFMVTELDDNTIPSLRSWGGVPTEKSLTKIAENNGIISFTIASDEVNEAIENFNPIQKETFTTEQVTGSIGTWTFSNARTYKAAEIGWTGEENHIVAVKNGKIEMTFDIAGKIKSVSFAGGKSASSLAMKTLRIEYSQDKGNTWQTYGENILISSSAMSRYIQRVELEGTCRFRIIGVASGEGYIDDFTIRYDLPTDILQLPESDTSIRLYREARSLRIACEQEIQRIRIYALNGTPVYTATPASPTFVVPMSGWSRGIYVAEIETADGKTVRKKFVN